ncbi:MAG TPA: diaminopimelate decarboxylase [bacterium]|nr:diaminopimelate decarboxylase [bacterium]HQJ65562.1 diaminopimelate decarboxylase [bacterium]
MESSKERCCRPLMSALAERHILREEDSALIFYDLTGLKHRIAELTDLFPESTLHAVAVKANPLIKVLEQIQEMGAGLEAASLPELCLARQAGVPPDRIVYDSPVKSVTELEYALQTGVHINADSIAELERIDTLLRSMPLKGTIGLRINPQVGTGAIPMLSVAGTWSKFGVPIGPQREKLFDCFLKYDWLSGIHLHVGSQGCELELIAKGIAKVLDLALEINRALERSGQSRRITRFDIGGGLPVSYHPGMEAPTMQDYAALLRHRFPALFDGTFQLITEFGRWVYAHNGWTISRVEYVKRDEKLSTAMIHVGADLLLRKCYRPEEWHHEISVAGPDGRLKNGLDPRPYTIAGPLCFAGDLIAREIRLPPVQEGDFLIIHDTGAYTLSMWSRYNSRQIPRVVGYTGEGDHFEVLRERESLEQVVAFWS